jgi:hypothetical protein
MWLPVLFSAICATPDGPSPSPRPSNLAEHYLSNLASLTTPEARNVAIMKCLAEIASIVDNAASKKAIQTELSTRLKAMLLSVDSRDKDLKTEFQSLFSMVTNLDNLTSDVINKTNAAVDDSMEEVRRKIWRRLDEFVIAALAANNQSIEAIEGNLTGAVSEDQRVSLIQSLIYFGLFQVLIAIALWIFRIYVKNQALDL